MTHATVQLTDHQYNTTNTKSEIEQITILYSTNSCELQREKEIETAGASWGFIEEQQGRFLQKGTAARKGEEGN